MPVTTVLTGCWTAHWWSRTAESALPSSAATSPSRCRPDSTTTWPPTTTGRRRTALRCRGPGRPWHPAVLTVSVRTDDEVGEGSVGDEPAVLPAEAAVAVHRRRSQQLVGGEPAALVARQPLVHLEAAHLLERVDDRVLVGAEARAGPPRRPGPGPGRCRRRGRARSWGRSTPSTATAEQLDVVVGQVGGVDRAEPVAQQPGLVEQLGGRRAVEHLGGEVLGRLLADVGVHDAAAGQTSAMAREVARAARPAPSGRPPRSGWSRPASRAATRVRPPVDVTVGEPALHLVERQVPVAGQPAGEVAGVEQGEPEPGVAGRLR